jgi:glutathione S-transferase
MTIDERIEALTHSLELVNAAHFATEQTLRRAIRLAVLESRAERRRRQELDRRLTESDAKLGQRMTESDARLEQRMTESGDRLSKALADLAAAQAVTEQKLQRYLESRGRNGDGDKS